MEIFLSLFFKIIPLYVLIGIGYIGAKYFDIKRDSIAKVAIYFASPAIVFVGIQNADLSTNVIYFPIVFFLVSTFICLINLFFAKFLWKDSTKNLFAMASANGNLGYFGIPVCIVLLGEESLPTAVAATFGLIVFEYTVGYYVLARSNYTVRESLSKIFKLPAIYAFIFGLLANVLHLTIPDSLTQTMELMKGAYTPLGMMIIGLGLATVKLHHIDKKFISCLLLNKFLLWLGISLFLVFLDTNYFHFFNEMIHKVFVIESITPIAANTAAFASILNIHPEKASIAIFISTIVALIFIPLVLTNLSIF